jgi:hypothetical protein
MPLGFEHEDEDEHEHEHEHEHDLLIRPNGSQANHGEDNP